MPCAAPKIVQEEERGGWRERKSLGGKRVLSRRGSLEELLPGRPSSPVNAAGPVGRRLSCEASGAPDGAVKLRHEVLVKFRPRGRYIMLRREAWLFTTWGVK